MGKLVDKSGSLNRTLTYQTTSFKCYFVASTIMIKNIEYAIFPAETLGTLRETFKSLYLINSNKLYFALL